MRPPRVQADKDKAPAFAHGQAADRQARVQLSERGFPLVGDVKYGGPRCGDGLKLHAVRLRVGEETYTALPPWAGPWRVAHLPPEWEDV